MVITTHLDDWPSVSGERKGWPWQPTGTRTHREENVAAEWPRISMVTPSFQQASTLEKTLRSVLLQNYPNLELIVMDGGSTDGTREILKKYGTHLAYWVSEKDRGQSHAINKGLERCTGEIFNWLNSDDTLEPDALWDVAELWRRERPILVSGDCDNILPDGRVDHHWTARPPKRLRDFFVPQAVVLAQPSTFLAMSAVRALGGVREDLECVMDWDLYVRLFLHFPSPWKTARVARTLARALQHPDAKTQRLAARFPEEAARLMNEWLPLAPSSERPAIVSRQKMMATQLLVTKTAQSHPSRADLLKLAFTRCEVLTSRFYWGALRRSFGAAS